MNNLQPVVRLLEPVFYYTGTGFITIVTLGSRVAGVVVTRSFKRKSPS